MKIRISKLIAIMIIFGVFMIPVPVTMAGGLSADPKMNAKIARIKAKQRAAARKAGTDGESVGRNTDGCGNVSIGNITNEKSSRGKQEIIVFIDGDVISTGNNCK